MSAPAAPTAAPFAGPGSALGRSLRTGDYVGFFAMVFGMFMAILDIQIVASSLTEIQAGLSAGPEEITWVQTSYLIAEVIMIPLSGWLTHVFSTRYLFVASALGFTLASLACAFAWNIESMMVFRAIQGFLGGAMIPTVFATSFLIFPPLRRAQMSILIGLVATMAPTLGPTLGGYITDHLSWHWLFLVNLVPGAILVVFVAGFAHFDRPQLHLLRGFDLAGIVLVGLFLGCLQYVLEEGPRDDWFASETIRWVFAVMTVSGILFFWRELTIENPVIDLWAFLNRNFALGCLYAFVLGVGLYGAVYVMPLFLGRVGGFRPAEIGNIMMVVGLFQFMSAPVAGILARRLDLRAELALGIGLFALGLFLNSILTAESAYWELFLPQALRGFALMLCFVPINQLALGLLPHHEIKNASGLYNLMRNLGGAIGLAAINTLIIDRYALHYSRLAEGLTPARPAAQSFLDQLAARVESLLPGADPQLAALKVLDQLVQREALVLTFSDALMVMAAVFGAAFLLLPLMKKVRPASASTEAH